MSHLKVWFQNRRSKERRMKQLSALGNRRHYYRNSSRIAVESQSSTNLTNLQPGSVNRTSINELDNSQSVAQVITARSNRFNIINDNHEVIGQNIEIGFINTGI